MIQESAANFRITPARRHGQFTPAESAWAVNADNLFEGADITYTTDERSFEYTGQPAPIGVSSIVDATGEVYTPGANPTTEGVDYTVRYFVDSNHNKKLDVKDTRVNETGNVNGEIAPAGAGYYFIVAMNETAYGNLVKGVADMVNGKAGYVAEYFEITNASLAEAAVVNVTDPDKGTYTEGFTYDTTDQTGNVGFVLDGKLLDPKTDYDVTYKPGTVQNAGEYTAELTGKGAYEGSTATVKFTVDKLDLSTATITTSAVQADESTGVNVGDCAVVNGDPDLTIQALVNAGIIDTSDSSAWGQVRYYGPDGKIYANGADGYEGWAKASQKKIGGYEIYAKAAESAEDNVVGDCHFTVDVVTETVDADSFLYDGVAMNDGDPDTVTDGELDGSLVDQSKGESYDASLFSIAGKKDVDFTVSLGTEEGNAVGTHTVVVEIANPGDYSIGGSSYATFTVVAGTIDTAEMDAVAIIDGVNVPFGSTSTPTYDGEAVVPAISVSCGDKALVAGEDYTVTYTDAAGNPVEEMVNAGTYTVTIESDAYEITDPNWFKVEIQKRTLDYPIKVVTNVQNSEAEPGILYTGEEIAVGFYGTFKNADNDEVKVALDPSWYLLSGLQYMAEDAVAYSPATQVLGVGSYKVNVSPTAACVNYTWKADNGVKFQVVDDAYFTDVHADQWYAGEVNDAATQGYIKGVGDTKLFMPMNSINRAELSQVLFNMAGQPLWGGIAYPTPFSDVPELAWFAQPVSWASQAGIVTGMGDTGTFAPYDNATREQVATMFYRYAQTQGMDVSGRADLSGYADEAAVSGWAADAVAWAVESGVFGQGTETLRPSDPISRAEVAAMAIRLQPEKLSSADDTQIGA